MNINLYQFSKRKNSTKQPGGSGNVVTGYLKEGANLRSPSLILKVSDVENFLKFNYMKMLGSFYYISDKKNLSATEWQIDCVLDELATYKGSINNTDAFVVYSSSEFDKMINDSRIAKKDYYVNARAKTRPTAYNAGNMYVLSVINLNGGGTPAKCYLLDETNMSLFTQGLTNPNVWSEISAMLNGDPMDKIVGCRAYNVNVAAFTSASSSTPIYVGTERVGSGTGIPLSYELATPESTVKNKVTAQIDLTDIMGEDYRAIYNRTYMVSVPFCGTYYLDPAKIYGRNYIIFEVGLDIISGEMSVTIFASPAPLDEGGVISQNAIVIDRVGGSCGRDIPLAHVQTNRGTIVSGVTGAISTIAGAYTGNAILASAGASTLAGMLSGTGIANNTITNGGIGGSPASNMTMDNYFVLNVLQNLTTQEPSDIAATQGRPCMKVCHLGDLSGYVQTSGASVSASAAGDIIQSLNASLDAGIYLE